ncbi:Cu(I)/Ag(I) efflux system membrane fusion protein [Tenacibaculum skagerrakense]|uniref:Cu(I)/Ag(I) efflux system membrane fusion protein n=1 Tax=Tenacibaculum skagerrakense TaxID=186571 RepID=A0A4R2NSF2_9FLAO|nr:efflux RND transporter periplasmic adaptor subunit [Tenacibaculum skagerrakense]TCP24305.1 Cu(I)/Ag(I) efflux system membrane fusion protein [Tenacibaculum skagerrakense]
MKKYIVYIVILLVGLFLGWLLFGNSSDKEVAHEHSEKSDVKQMWTCSMHPQIMQPEAGDCPICGMDLIPAASGSEGLAADQFKLTENAMALANVQTTVIGDSLEEGNTITLSGKIVENEETNLVQASYFQGRIERLYINSTGEKITNGQLLATIYAPELIKAQQELLTASSLKESQPALYEAVRKKLKLWKLSDAQIKQIESSKKIKENFPIYATVSGVVIQKIVAQGDYVKQGEPLLKVSNLSTVWANFDIYENQIGSLKKGQEIMVSTNAFPNEVFKSKIAFIDPVMNPSTRTTSVRVELSNKDSKFKPGMFVIGKADVHKTDNDKELSIPASAVLWTGKRSIVYVKVKSDAPVFEMREVVLGNRVGDNYIIVSGINSGEEVVTNGTFTIDASAQLAGKKSMMNHSKSTADVFEVSSMFKDQLQKVYNNYIVLKDNLITSNSATAKLDAEKLKKSLEDIDMKLLTDAKAHEKWMILYKTLKSKSTLIAKTSDIKEQRREFKPLSNHLIAAVESFGITETTYKLYCPMADSDKGGFWLSKEAKVLNPYFGDMMLKCGEIKETINNK